MCARVRERQRQTYTGKFLPAEPTKFLVEEKREQKEGKEGTGTRVHERVVRVSELPQGDTTEVALPALEAALQYICALAKYGCKNTAENG